MLKRATAADAEVRTGRRHTIRTGGENLRQLPSPAITGDANALSRQGQRHEQAGLGHPVALGADSLDRERIQIGQAAAASSLNSSRSLTFSILPLALRGRVSGQKMTRTGTLNAASRSATKARSSASVA